MSNKKTEADASVKQDVYQNIEYDSKRDFLNNSVMTNNTLLEKELKNLIIKHSLQSIAALLVYHNVLTLESLIEKLNKPDSSSLFNSKINSTFKSQNKIESKKDKKTLPTFVESHIKDELLLNCQTWIEILRIPIKFTENSKKKEWLYRFGEEYSELIHVHQLPYSKLENILSNGDISNTDRKLIEKLWIDSEKVKSGNNIRTPIYKAVLPLGIIDLLEDSHRLSSISDMTDDIYDSVVKKIASAADKNKFLKLFKENSSEYKSKEAVKTTKYKEKIDQAKADIKVLQDAVTKNITSPDDLKKRLDGIKSSLKDSSISGDGGQNWILQDPTDFKSSLEVLKNIDTELSASLSSYTKPVVVDDAKLISDISGAEIQFGIPFGMHPRFIGKTASAKLFKPPQYARLTACSLPFTFITQEFSSSEASTKYNDTLTKSGSSFASELQASGWGFSVSAGINKSSTSSKDTIDKKRTESTSATKSKVLTIPIKSFKLEMSDMVFTDEAKSDIKKIRDVKQAELFLEKYYSHFSLGIHHVGGIFIQSTTVKTEKEHSVQSLLEKASESFGVGAGAGGGACGFSFAASTRVENFSENATGSGGSELKTKCTVESQLYCYGPAVSNPDLFAGTLYANSDTWHIIDRSGPHTYVPIWKLLERDDDKFLKPKALLIKQAWLNMAKLWTDFNSDCNISKIIQNVEEFDFTPGVDEIDENVVDNLPIEFVADQIEKQISLIIGDTFNIANMSKNQISSDVDKVFSLIQGYKYMYKKDFIPQLMTFPTLSTLILAISQSNQNEKTHGAKKIVSLHFNKQTIIEIQQNPQTSNYVEEKILDKILHSNQKDQTKQLDVEGKNETYVPVLIESLQQLADECNILVDATIEKENKSIRLAQLISENLLPTSVSPDEKELGDLIRERMKIDFELLDGSFADQLDDSQITLCISHIVYYTDCFKRKPDNQTLQQFIQEEKEKKEATSTCHYEKSKTKLDTIESILVDNSHLDPSKIELKQHLVKILKHQLLFKSLETQMSSTSQAPKSKSIKWGKTRKAQEQNEIQNDSSEQTKSVYSLILSILYESPIQHQKYILSNILHRRMAVPILTCKVTDQNQSIDTFIDSLAFLNISISQTETCNISKDTSLQRVVVFSDRSLNQSGTTTMLKNLFSCQSLNQFTTNFNDYPSTTLEAGFGFIQNGDKQEVVIIFHIIGDHKPLLPWFIKNKLAHFYLGELDPSLAQCSSFIDTFKNDFETCSLIAIEPSLNTIDECEQMFFSENEDEERSYAKFIGTITSGDTEFSKNICDLITSKFEDSNPLSESPMIPMFNAMFNDNGCTGAHTLTLKEQHINGHTTFKNIQNEVDSVVKEIDFKTFRQNMFQLQHSFAREVETEIRNDEYLQREGPSAVNRTTAKDKIEREIDSRKQKSQTVSNNPLIKLFIQGISRNSPNERSIFIDCLENLISFYSRPSLAVLYKEFTAAEHLRIQNPDSYEFRHRSNIKKKSHEQASLHIEHIWREISHLNNYKQLSSYAAHHLVDGFPLEIVDGDAGKINIDWVKSVLKHLSNILQEKNNGVEPRIFVLSILGVQSSGKSTLLNILFGCKFRVSVGMTTKGMNLMLIPVKGRSEYDYVLLLDTEGVRSDKSDLNGKKKDNRLAAFSIWPADATIIMNAGEDTTAIKDIIPVVGHAFQKSTLAEKYGMKLLSRLFFVQRGIIVSATNSVGAEDDLKNRLHSDLFDLLQSISINPQNNEANENDSILLLLKGFNVKTDHIILGMNKESGNPPKDIPNEEYGRKLIEFRDHIHSRTVGNQQWKAKTIKEWIDILREVWPAIKSSNLELSKESIAQKKAHDIINDCFQSLRFKLSQKYSEIFQVLIEEVKPGSDVHKQAISELSNSISNRQPTKEEILNRTVEIYQFNCKNATRELIKASQMEIDQMKENPQLSPFLDHITLKSDQWEAFLHSEENKYMKRISTLVSNNIFYQDIVDLYKNQVRDEASKVDTKESVNWPPETMYYNFEKIFRPIVQKAKEDFPDVKVELEIRQVFKSHNIEIDEPNKENISIWQSFLNWSSNIASSIFSTKKKEDLIFPDLEIIITKINKEIIPGVPYSGHLVRNAIEITNNNLGHKHHKSIKQIYFVVYHHLVDRLTTIQRDWEKINSVQQRLLSSKDTLYEAFKSRCKNLNLIESVREHLLKIFQNGSDHLNSAFKYRIYQNCIHEITSMKDNKMKYAWAFASNPEAMQAFIDLDIYNISTKGNDPVLFQMLKKSSDHYNSIINRLVVEIIKDSIATKDSWSNFRSELSNILTSGQISCSDFTSNNIGLFLTYIKRKLPHQLGSPILDVSYFSGSAIDSKDDEDSLPDGVFTDLVQSIINSMPTDTLEDMPVQIDDPDQINSIRDMIKTEMVDNREGKSLAIRCQYECPECSLKCIMDNNHEGKHTTYHQPNGLNGSSYTKSGALIDESCVELYNRNCTVVSKNGDYKIADAWPTRYSNWEIPKKTIQLELREYIFYHKYSSLSTYHYCNEKTPPENFKHNIDDLLQKLKNKAGNLVDYVQK